jgi:hypothetical protein
MLQFLESIKFVVHEQKKKKRPRKIRPQIELQNTKEQMAIAGTKILG